MVWTHSSWKLNIKGFFQFHFYSSSIFFIHAYDIPKEILSMDVWVGTLASFLVILTTEANYNVTLFFPFWLLVATDTLNCGCYQGMMPAKKLHIFSRQCHGPFTTKDQGQCFQEILISNRVFHWLRCHRLRTNDPIISRHIKKKTELSKTTIQIL